MKKIIRTSFHALWMILVMMSFTTSFAQNLQISGGNNFSAAICDNQTVYVWGANTSNQLGITAADAPVAGAYANVATAVTRGNINNTTTGLTYGVLPAIRQIDAGSGAHLLGLACTGQVWGWGDGTTGQLGRNSLVNSPIPQRVLRGAQVGSNPGGNDPNMVFLNNIFYVSGGNNSSFALENTTGRVLSWGQNTNGQLGIGTAIDSPIPVYVLRAASEGGGQLTNIIQIEGGDDCTYALDANGNVWSWGDNVGHKLGRPGAGVQSTAARVVQGDPMNNGYSGTPAPTVFLRNIVQISGGDAHCLALDVVGNVWSFGGDWGEGQLGRAGGSVYQDDARKVSIPGITTYATANNQFLGNGVDGRAVFVSAGQAMSSVVMENGKVVTFGARGLYNSGATPIAPTGSITCPGTGDMITSGSLGDGNAACNSSACNGNAAQWSRTPRYVTSDAGGTHLTGITSVSDGDAWFFAISSAGNAFAWGWNRRGELGLGDYVDRCFAVPFTLPSGCSFSAPCPGRPNLGPDVITCPVFSQILNSNVTQTFSSYRYTWEYRPGTSGLWTGIGAPLGNNVSHNAAQSIGQYRVSIIDNRTSVPFLCAQCPIFIDTITFTPNANPYTVDGCFASPNSTFSISNPTASEIKWYTTPTGGTPLNPSDVNRSITVPTTTAPITASCGAGNRALFAEDVASTQSVLRPGTTLATAPNAGAGDVEDGQRSPLEVQVLQTLTITEVSIIQPNQTHNYSSDYTVEIFNNDNVNGGHNCGSCTPSNSRSGITNPTPAPVYTSPMLTIPFVANNGNTIRQIPLNATLAPGLYWIRVRSTNNGVINFTNTPAANTAGIEPRWNVTQTSTPNPGLNAVMAHRDGAPSRNSHLFNIRFQTGTGYTCGRILVCQSAINCPAPVNFLYFNATQVGTQAQLNWATAAELRSKHFNVQRSSDGINWVTIGQVNAAGTSSALKEYSYTDTELPYQMAYYRIEEVSNEGATQVTNIELLIRSSNLLITVTPNPSNGIFTLSIKGASQTTSISLVNALGQKVYESSAYIEDAFEQELSLTHLSKGMYLLSVANRNESKVSRIILE